MAARADYDSPLRSGIGSAFVHGGIADFLYVAVALVWLVPDRRIETQLNY